MINWINKNFDFFILIAGSLTIIYILIWFILFILGGQNGQ